VQHSHKETAFKFHSLRVLLGFVGTTAVFHLFYATLRGAGAYGNPWRWIEYGITATMLTLNAAVGVGVSSVDAVILLIASSACMQVSGLGLELSRGMPWMREIFLFIGFTIVISIIISIAWYSTTASGSLVNTERIASVYGVYYGSFGVAATLRAYDIGAWRSAAWTELVYIVLSLSSKTSLFWMSFGGTRQMIEHLAPAEPRCRCRCDASPLDQHSLTNPVSSHCRKGVDWAYVQDVAAFAPGAVAIAFLLIAAFLKPRARENKAIVMCGDEPGFIATIS